LNLKEEKSVVKIIIHQDEKQVDLLNEVNFYLIKNKYKNGLVLNKILIKF